MLSREQYDRLREIFFAVAERAPDERNTYLDEACAGDPEARREIEALLARDASDTDALEPDGAGARANRQAMARMLIGIPPEPPPIIGRYRVTRRLAVGGMGCVYEAEQEAPLRRVALKVLHPGLASARMLRRFEFESQVLALLKHPGIAQVYEAGTIQTPEGPQAFFAMELVAGRPLLEHAKVNELSIRERLELLARVCDAVHHAHQKGVIHRDLKPANILVLDEGDRPERAGRMARVGQPKVLDFGVARVTDLELQATTLRTDVGQLIGTVPYMSPEQASGARDAIDTRSDVYTLGVLGYELLTGRLPHDLDGLALHQALELIRQAEPARLGSLDAALRGDVEIIFAKALEKDLQRRYDSAASLAADLRRHVHHEPIQARPPTPAYQMRKFARRHRSLVGAVAGAAVLLVLGTAGTAMGLVHARSNAREAMLARDDAEAKAREAMLARADADAKAREATLARADADAKAREATLARDDAEAVTRFLEGMLESANVDRLGRDVLVRDILDEAATRVTTAFADRPLVEARLRLTIARTYEQLGQFDRAAEHASVAIETRTRLLGATHRQTIESRLVLYEVWRDLGKLAETATALESLATDCTESLGLDDPLTLITVSSLGDVERNRRRLREAEVLLMRALAGLSRVLGPEHEETLGAQASLAGLYFSQGRYFDAEQLYEKTLAAWTRVEPESTHVRTIASNLGLLYIRDGRYARAEALYTELIARIEALLGPDHPSVLTALNNLATLYSERGDRQGAAQVYGEVLERRKRVLGESHPKTLISMSNYANELVVLKQYDEAETLFLRSLELCRKVHGPGHEHEFHILNGLGLQYILQDRNDEAEPLLRDAYLGAKGMFVAGDNRTARFQRNYGRCLGKLLRFEEAEPHLVEGYEALLAGLGPNHTDTKRSVKYLAQLYEAWDRPEEAAKYRALLPPDPETSDASAQDGPADAAAPQPQGTSP